MAKLYDKLYNRKIVGKLVLDTDEVEELNKEISKDKVKEVTVQSITSISSELLESLKCGDVVSKEDSTGKHAYKVTYKSSTGLCLSYYDCENVETVAYNKSGDSWSYDDTTVTPINNEIKVGYYVMNANANKYIYVGGELPESYSGFAICITDDGFLCLESYLQGELEYSGNLATSSFTIIDEVTHNVATFGRYGAEKINYTTLTHSFSELDSTLREIVEDAIGDSSGVACTQEQWNAIKELLDKSLFINYQGYSMIKTASNGINLYMFGGTGSELVGSRLELSYNDTNSLLFAYYNEL